MPGWQPPECETREQRMPAGQVVLEPFEPLPARDEALLESDAADLVRFLGR